MKKSKRKKKLKENTKKQNRVRPQRETRDARRLTIIISGGINHRADTDKTIPRASNSVYFINNFIITYVQKSRENVVSTTVLVFVTVTTHLPPNDRNENCSLHLQFITASTISTSSWT